LEKVKTILWGFGAMGQGIAEMLLDKKGVEIVGVCDLNPELKGKTVSEVLEKGHNNVKISNDIDNVLENNADVLFLATDSYTSKSYSKIEKVLKAGVNVISTAEEMSYPYASEPELSKKMDEIAKENNVSVLGTGINPGFVMDVLAISLTGAMTDVKGIEVRRVNSLSPFGKTVMEEQGVGISMDEFNDRSQKNELAGHVGFKESVYMIADALGLELDDFEQQMKPIITTVNRKSKYGKANKGTLAGIDMTAQGTIKGKEYIKMSHPQQIEPEDEGINTGDYIILHGSPEIKMSITPEIEGGLGTIAMCVNMMPHIINAEPGLKTMLDLPIPRAIMGDVRKNIIKK